MTEERKPRLEDLEGGFHRYLGDGVYAAFDGNNVTLRTGSHFAPVAVYIDHEIMEALTKYYKDLHDAIAEHEASRRQE